MTSQPTQTRWGVERFAASFRIFRGPRRVPYQFGVTPGRFAGSGTLLG